MAFRNPRNVRLLLTTSRAYQQPASHSYAPCLCQSVAPLPRADLWPDLVRRCDTVTSMSISWGFWSLLLPTCHRSSPGSHCNRIVNCVVEIWRTLLIGRLISIKWLLQMKYPFRGLSLVSASWRDSTLICRWPIQGPCRGSANHLHCDIGLPDDSLLLCGTN